MRRKRYTLETAWNLAQAGKSIRARKNSRYLHLYANQNPTRQDILHEWRRNRKRHIKAIRKEKAYRSCHGYITGAYQVPI